MLGALCVARRKMSKVEGKETCYTISGEDFRRALQLEPFMKVDRVMSGEVKVQRQVELVRERYEDLWIVLSFSGMWSFDVCSRNFLYRLTNHVKSMETALLRRDQQMDRLISTSALHVDTDGRRTLSSFFQFCGKMEKSILWKLHCWLSS